jgi:hypothetical protein
VVSEDPIIDLGFLKGGLCTLTIGNGNGAICDQKIFKFFVSHVEESVAGHVDANGVY